MSRVGEQGSLSKRPHLARRFLQLLPYLMSAIALAISGLQAYRDSLKPFALSTWLNPAIQIQHKVNLGVYVDFAVKNTSPTSGVISRLALVLYRKESPRDKYLLPFFGYRVETETGVWSPLEPLLVLPRPLFLNPDQWEVRTANFIYVNAQEFPIASGEYIAELFIWTDYERKPRYREAITFVVSADVLAAYFGARDRGSTGLQPISSVGVLPVSGRKLTDAEYQDLDF